MRFLADECCDFAAVRALRADGHDVITVADVMPHAIDPDVLQRALSEKRILLTEDKDFGAIVYASRAESPGVVLFRFPASARAQIGPSVVALVREFGSSLPGAFTVLQPGSARITPRRGNPISG
ncbi:MAG TPA: DUF5615 family PIN-like protein [Bryobacteraceae bacterium]|nr:DUF5615 family PIN-like protein [Bryobacteraceae bacterium]